ncbi:MAG: hypothetical protein PHQ61_04815 [Candidatus Omnitrophica bacterium]|nr:hypothetical protein [Candidatus Omnitrophota bacterium]
MSLSMFRISEEKFRAVMKYRWHVVLFLAIVAVVYICYGATLDHPFIWDDYGMICDNIFITDWSFIGDIFRSSSFGMEDAGICPYYRPLPTLTFLVNYKLSGMDPHVFREVNIWINILNAFLVFLVLSRFGLSRRAASAVALIFCAHPVNIETVTLIAGRVDSLFIFFGMISLLALTTYSANGRRTMLAVSFFALILSFLCNEKAISFAAIEVIYYFLYERNKRDRSVEICISAVILFTYFYLVNKINFLVALPASMSSHIAIASMHDRIATFPRILFTYFRLIFAPTGLYAEYHFVETGILNRYLLIWTPVILGGVYAMIRHLKYSREAGLFAFWVFSSVLIYNNVVYAHTATFREHWVCMGVIGAFALVALFLGRLAAGKKIKWKALLLCFFAAYMGFLCYNTIARNKEWADPLVLYGADLAREPRNSSFASNLALEYLKRGELDKANELYLRALRNAPYNMDTKSLVGIAYIMEERGQNGMAAFWYHKALRQSEIPFAYERLAELAISASDYGYAEYLLERAINRYPGILGFYLDLGRVYMLKGDYMAAREILGPLKELDEAREYLDEIERTAPGDGQH